MKPDYMKMQIIWLSPLWRGMKSDVSGMLPQVGPLMVADLHLTKQINNERWEMGENQKTPGKAGNQFIYPNFPFNRILLSFP